MKIKAAVRPVKKIAAPKYPDQYSVELDRLLLANRPLRWNAAPAVCTALSAVVMLSLTGCVTQGTPVPPPPPPPTPLFEHGEGIGVYGCVSVSAPVFLSEDDAFAIISDEFSKLDLNIMRDAGKIDNIMIPIINVYDEDKKVGMKTGSLDYDFSVEGKNIVMEFVSSEDVKAWQPESNYWSSVSHENYKEAAKVLNNSLNKAYKKEVHGVFYDPGERTGELWADTEERSMEELMDEARERANAELREQVKDFIAWLSAQGII